MFSVILCDVDRFKTVNDSCGHAVGGRVLAEAARRLARGLRTNDVSLSCNVCPDSFTQGTKTRRSPGTCSGVDPAPPRSTNS